MRVNELEKGPLEITSKKRDSPTATEGGGEPKWSGLWTKEKPQAHESLPSERKKER